MTRANRDGSNHSAFIGKFERALNSALDVGKRVPPYMWVSPKPQVFFLIKPRAIKNGNVLISAARVAIMAKSLNWMTAVDLIEAGSDLRIVWDTVQIV